MNDDKYFKIRPVWTLHKDAREFYLFKSMDDAVAWCNHYSIQAELKELPNGFIRLEIQRGKDKDQDKA